MHFEEGKAASACSVVQAMQQASSALRTPKELLHLIWLHHKLA
jgi:hypothetical protein